MDEPKVCFSKWRKYILRDRLSEESDVPKDYGLLGVYLLAPPFPSDNGLYHLSPEVICIRMSRLITQRLEKYHKAISKYKKESRDFSLKNLYYTEWLSPWSNWNQYDDSGQVKLAFIHFTERKLIWEYAKRHHRLPKYNCY